MGSNLTHIALVQMCPRIQRERRFLIVFQADQRLNGDEDCVFEPNPSLVLWSNICWLKKPRDLPADSALSASDYKSGFDRRVSTTPS